MARASAGFAPAGMLSARTLPPSISSLSGGSRRRRPGTGRTACGVLVRSRTYTYVWIRIRVRWRRAEHAGDLRLVEEREEHADALDDRRAELGVERRPVMQIPPLDGLDLLAELAPRSAPALLRLVCDLEFLEPVPECGVELASRLVRAGHRLPAPVLEETPCERRDPWSRRWPAPGRAGRPARGPRRSSGRTVPHPPCER